MTTEELNRLLGKYYDGESTKEEESALRLFFLENDVPEGYDAEKEIFSYYRYAAEVPEPSSDFESRILAGIDENESTNRSVRLRKLFLPVISIAAGLLIMAGSYFFFIHNNEPRNTYTDPEIAYAETMKILMDVSAQLNRGTKALEPVSKMSDVATKSFSAFDKPARVVEKNLKNLEYLQKAIEITNVPDVKSINK
jgi:hypothetical protein